MIIVFFALELWKNRKIYFIFIQISIKLNLKLIFMQTKTYKTRISVLLVLIILIIGITPLFFPPKEDMIFMAPITITVLFLLAAVINIKYVIDGDTLKIYSFFWIHNDIDIKSIKRMEPSRCILSSPAASLKRLAIHYNKYDVVYISPRNQEDFINEINKKIKV